MADTSMQTVPTVTFKEGACCENNLPVLLNNTSNEMIRKVSSTSRFQVDRVNSVTDDPDDVNNTVDDAESPAHRNKDDSRQSFESPTFGSSPPVSPTDTYASHNSFSNPYETNFKTFGRYTTEALPHMDHYRNLLSATTAMKSRPTLAELHEEKDTEENFRSKAREKLLASEEKLAEEGLKKKSQEKGALKFGWVKGVLIRCLLNIWGVMLFMRLSWVVGQSGVGFATLIILLSAVVTTLTSLSMSAICTNGEVKGGGAYFMISRSLGPEFGGAIGLVFSVANAVAVAMYVVGFSETVRDILKVHNALMVDEVNDIRIIGVLTITFLLFIAIIGMEWEARAQLILLGLLLVAIANFMIGTFIPSTPEQISKGIVGYKGKLFVENLGPKYTDGENFFSVFAVFFPAATGILAGANISGDLKNAQRNIPKGTFYSILISTIVYIGIAWVLGATIMREASGYAVTALQSAITTNVSANGSYQSSLTNTSAVQHQPSAFSLAQNCSLGMDGKCEFGLLHDYQTMETASGFGPLVTVGIFSATLSSALASLVSAPKVFQAVCKDKIFPKIHIFAKGYGPSDNPRRAYLLAYFIGVAFICIGDLNAIAPIISNFFLMSYALINYSCFDASLARSPGWRPAFKYYYMWLSLIGALVCIAVMFIINWWTALITFAVIAFIFVYVHYTKPDVNWGSSTQAHVYRSALQSALKLLAVEDHIKNFRPQILVLTGLPSSRPALVDFVYTLTRKISLMMCGHILIGNQSDCLREINRYKSGTVYQWFKQRKVKSFYSVTSATSFRQGAQSIMQNVGVGKMRPNIVVMGFKSDWRTTHYEEVDGYFNTIHDAFDLEFGVGILRVTEGFYCETNQNEAGHESLVQHKLDADEEEIHSYPSTPTMLRKHSHSSEGSFPDHNGEMPQRDDSHQLLMSENRLRQQNRFAKKQKKGTIDVWWLFDDGGLTLLIPYILTTKLYWGNCRLRIFIAGTKRGEIDREQRQMATLLSKFRIECKEITVIADIGKSPEKKSEVEFDKLLEGWMLDEESGESQEKYPWKISEEEKDLLQDKTKRNIRLKELLVKHSSDASLVVMTLPMPRKGTCPTGLYMAWLDTLTRDMPPILLLRGNQSSVLTFYS
ncbi:solute carrier family 12 member 2-like isoform X2 [Mizuhopecten yessoensis]|uniref:Solute carrier family 12 member 2 n=1 Tax=Mizuhopecten yessoensis TaxID=6573 RepID=A0A210QIJ6_MIZYE|nr:solute carrier family 12 member 2-like isoform X2 [Mizuhopecten yessoensis]OWF48421.1 Solute carrier family 12 member 2 [Mizuhopecten yessoensis]